MVKVVDQGSEEENELLLRSQQLRGSRSFQNTKARLGYIEAMSEVMIRVLVSKHEVLDLFQQGDHHGDGNLKLIA